MRHNQVYMALHKNALIQKYTDVVTNFFLHSKITCNIVERINILKMHFESEFHKYILNSENNQRVESPEEMQKRKTLTGNSQNFAYHPTLLTHLNDETSTNT